MLSARGEPPRYLVSFPANHRSAKIPLLKWLLASLSLGFLSQAVVYDCSINQSEEIFVSFSAENKSDHSPTCLDSSPNQDYRNSQLVSTLLSSPLILP